MLSDIVVVINKMQSFIQKVLFAIEAQRPNLVELIIVCAVGALQMGIFFGRWMIYSLVKVLRFLINLRSTRTTWKGIAEYQSTKKTGLNPSD